MPRVRRLIPLAAVLTVIAGCGDHAAPAPKPVTIIVDSGDPGRAPDQKVTIPGKAVQQAASSEAGHHDGLHSETPEGVPAATIEAGREQQDQLAERDDLPIVTPLAAPEQAGCSSRFVRNYSSRRGVAPRLFVMHYTVSQNRPGWSDVDAIVSLFDRASFQASSNYVIDGEGHCAYIVRESDKAWTQATFNPVSISIEVINTGSEKALAATAGLAKIGKVVADATKRWNIPLRLGAVSGCTVTKSGVVMHQTLGQCGGGHHDISPYALGQVIAAAQKARGTSGETQGATHDQIHKRLSELGCASSRRRARHPAACAQLYKRNRDYHQAH